MPLLVLPPAGEVAERSEVDGVEQPQSAVVSRQQGPLPLETGNWKLETGYWRLKNTPIGANHQLGATSP